MQAPTNATTISMTMFVTAIPTRPGQPAAEECAEDSDDDVPDQAQAVACHDLAGQEPGERSDEDEHDQTFHTFGNLR